MKKNLVFGSLVFVILMFAANSLAGTSSIPNTFVSGQIATAAGVNENFNAVKTAIDDNANNITSNSNNINAKKTSIVKDSTGTIIGTLIGVDKYGILTLMSSKGYLFRVNKDGNLYWYQGSTNYDSADCQGNPYLEAAQSVDWNGVDYLYVPKATAPSFLRMYSNKYLNGSVFCANGGATSPVWRYLAQPNDPDITGVPNSNVSMPITIEFQ